MSIYSCARDLLDAESMLNDIQLRWHDVRIQLFSDNLIETETAYQMMSPPLRPCPPSGAVLRLTYSAALTTLTNSAFYRPTLTIVVLVVVLLLRPL